MQMKSNAYFDGATDRYIASSTASDYYQNAGTHVWRTAPSGTAGNAISFVQDMTLAGGNLGVGTASPEALVHVNKAASGGEGGFVFIENSAGSALGNKAGIRFATDTGGSFSGYAGFLECVNTNFNNGAADLVFGTWNGAARGERARIPAAGGMVVGTAALATSATDGFLYVPTCAGTPTGVPTTQTGTAAIVINTTNNKLYFYSGGAWRDAGP
jgi:hypothetical protein